MTSCSKPSCAQHAAVVLAYDYSQRRIVLEDRRGEISPHVYAMCARCSERLIPPRGWTLEDQRTDPALFPNAHRLGTLVT